MSKIKVKTIIGHEAEIDPCAGVPVEMHEQVIRETQLVSELTSICLDALKTVHYIIMHGQPHQEHGSEYVKIPRHVVKKMEVLLREYNSTMGCLFPKEDEKA